MTKQALSDREVKLALLVFLVRKGRWGAHYFPVETIVNWFSRKIERDGRRARKLIEELVNESYAFLHKGRHTISLNPARSKEILDMISVT
jgi:hypothetical protein